MKSPPEFVSATAQPSKRGWNVSVALLLVVAPALVYLNSLNVPLVLDDAPVVLENPSIRTLWPPSVPLSPPAGGLPVCSRPVANVSLAINYAIGGERGWSYHALNIALHVGAALALCALLRRTLASSPVPARIRGAADELALAIASLWALHPLQTAAVTYLSQRTELLASLFFLLTLLAFARAAEPRTHGASAGPGAARAHRPWAARRVTAVSEAPANREGEVARTSADNAHGQDAHATIHADHGQDARATTIHRGWALAAVVCCAAGMASKEVMAAAPLIVLLYDRTFLAGSFAAAWRQRGAWHAAMMSTWALLAWLVLGAESRGGTAGFGLGVTPLAYAATQAEAIVRYLGLVVWPHPLVFDYGDYLTEGLVRAALFAIPVIALLGLTLVALRRWPAAGFVGAMFFAVLAPSSSVVPVATQTIAEHRMHLPLALVLTLLASGVYAWLGRRRAVAVFVVGALAAGGLTVARNQDYATVERLWRDTVEKRPDNVRARNNLAAALLEQGRTEEGLVVLETALRLRPRDPDVLRNLGQAELKAGRVDAALGRAEMAQQIDPSSALGWSLLGRTRLAAGQADGAVDAFREAISRRPDLAGAYVGLGDAELARRNPAAAAAAYREASRLRPKATETLFRLADALIRADREKEAIAAFEELRRLDPAFPGLAFGYGNALLQAGRAAEALAEFDRAFAQDGPSAPLLCSRAVALAELARVQEAAAAVREALRLDPDYAPARELARALGEAE